MSISASMSDWRGCLVTRKGKDGAEILRPVLANVIAILSSDERWENVIAYDAFREASVVLKAPAWDAQDAPHANGAGEWTDSDSTRTCAWLSRHYALDVHPAMVDQAIAVVAERRQVHPVRDWLGTLRWDMQHRVDSLFTRYFGAQDTPYNRGVGARFMIGAVARVHQPGAKVDCTPVLEGSQGIGKSTGIRKLAGDEWFFDTPIVMGDKDGYQALRGKWIGELGELHSLGRSDLNRAKNFLTATIDTYRPSFGRRTRDFARQCVFVGTTNATEYLRDETGNRRFWPVRCGTVDLKAIGDDREQLWAEALARYLGKERWHVDSLEFAKLCEVEQEERFVSDAWEAPISEWVMSRGHPDRRTDGVTTGEVLSGALSITSDKWGKADQDRAASVLRRLGWERGNQARERGQVVRRWRPRTASLVTLVTGDDPPSSVREKCSQVTTPVTSLEQAR